MSFRAYLILMGLGTILSAAAWIFIMNTVTPAQAEPLDLAFFYITLTFALIGLFSIIGVLIRLMLARERVVATRVVQTSFRQGAFLSILGIASLALGQRKTVSWWIILVLMAVVCALEIIFIRIERGSRR